VDAVDAVNAENDGLLGCWDAHLMDAVYCMACWRRWRAQQGEQVMETLRAQLFEQVMGY